MRRFDNRLIVLFLTALGEQFMMATKRYELSCSISCQPTTVQNVLLCGHFGRVLRVIVSPPTEASLRFGIQHEVRCYLDRNLRFSQRASEV
ncbi:hypothetical protein F5X97DRAFT_42442 [Nemania serpens]|nr:hypothetical protein F5X97DRAFT_42442 [Nemania serpens]